jgi:outer membrane receptor protein involved in Fe transport
MKDVEQSNAGNMFSNTPRATFDMGFMYRHELSGNKIIYWSPSFYTQSKEYFNDSNTPEYLQGSYILLNANVGMQFVRDRVTYDIGIFGHNITNTKYLIHAGNGSEALGLPTCEIGYPATFNLSLRLFFK